MAATQKKKAPDKITLQKAYIQYTLEKGEYPGNVFQFCAWKSWQEADFYRHFGSLDALGSGIWDLFFEQTAGKLEQDPAYAEYGSRERMLGFFFSFFETLTPYRTYVLYALEPKHGPAAQLRQLAGLRRHIRQFARQLPEGAGEPVTAPLGRIRNAVFPEAVWAQTLFLLRFWVKDGSAEFEKTDIAIEKSVHTLFDVMDHSPLDRVVDLGKFLIRENPIL